MYVCLLFLCSQNKHTVVDTLVRYSHWFAVFQTGVPSFFTKTPLSFCLLIILFPSPLSFYLSAVHSSLFLGLVVWRSSTHEQLDV